MVAYPIKIMRVVARLSGNLIASSGAKRAHHDGGPLLGDP